MTQFRPCLDCGLPGHEHIVSSTDEFFYLECPGELGGRTRLAPWIMPAVARTNEMFDWREVQALWQAYGKPRVADLILVFQSTLHFPASGCTRCPPAWPIECGRGGCTGRIHAVVSGRGQRYSRDDLPPWRDLHRVYATDDDFVWERRGLRLDSRCDRCGVPATEMRRRKAQRDLEQLRREAA